MLRCLVETIRHSQDITESNWSGYQSASFSHATRRAAVDDIHMLHVSLRQSLWCCRVVQCQKRLGWRHLDFNSCWSKRGRVLGGRAPWGNSEAKFCCSDKAESWRISSHNFNVNATARASLPPWRCIWAITMTQRNRLRKTGHTEEADKLRQCLIHLLFPVMLEFVEH